MICNKPYGSNNKLTSFSVSQGGTGTNSLLDNGVLVGNDTGAIDSVVSGSAGLCLVSTVGMPTWSTCPGSGGYSRINNPLS